MMSAFYLVSRLFLSMLHATVRFRTGRLERAFVRTSTAAEQLAKDMPVVKDQLSQALLSHDLAQAARERRTYENAYVIWQKRSESLRAFRERVKAWSGKALIYLAVEAVGLVWANMGTIQTAYKVIVVASTGTVDE